MITALLESSVDLLTILDFDTLRKYYFCFQITDSTWEWNDKSVRYYLGNSLLEMVTKSIYFKVTYHFSRFPLCENKNWVNFRYCHWVIYRQGRNTAAIWGRVFGAIRKERKKDHGSLSFFFLLGMSWNKWHLNYAPRDSYKHAGAWPGWGFKRAVGSTF